MGTHWGIVVCSSCKEPYWFKSGGGGPMQDYEDWDCPYCGAHEGREKTGGVPETRKLTADERRDWRGGGLK